jgi:pyruvate formate lyase activating enzyme
MKIRANFWENIENKKTKCRLCAHNCIIDDEKTGSCRVRKNENGELFSLIYGSSSSIAADPIEKKPLYHFFPGTTVFSLGTVGCNFKCLHCQNYSISTAGIDLLYIRELKPEDVLRLAKQYNCKGVSYTYNEPTIWHEFCYDSAKLVKDAGLYTCYVTNGYINPEPLKDLSIVLDAMNIDIKSFSEDFYKKICRAKLEPVLNTCKLAKKLGIHIELTYLVIPSLNDSPEEIKKLCKWVVKELGEITPIHFSRFHPDYKMNDLPMTPIKTLLNFYDIAKKEGILYPYLGNIQHGEYENTICPNCNNLCIIRNGYSTFINNIKNGKCTKCGSDISITHNL